MRRRHAGIEWPAELATFNGPPVSDGWARWQAWKAWIDARFEHLRGLGHTVADAQYLAVPDEDTPAQVR